MATLPLSAYFTPTPTPTSATRKSAPTPQSLATSHPITDRESVFTGTLYPAPSPASARAAVAHLRRAAEHSERGPATHCISAWRCMVLKVGRAGVLPADFVLSEGSDDDGESRGGKVILDVMRAEGVLDAVVVVARWYGGVLLGPRRFEHIARCAGEVCGVWRRGEKVRERVGVLEGLDGELEALRREFVALGGAGGAGGKGLRSPASAGDDRYADLRAGGDLERVERLVKAREKAVGDVRALVEERRARVGVGAGVGCS